MPTAVGTVPMHVTYSDYREVPGLRNPRRRTESVGVNGIIMQRSKTRAFGAPAFAHHGNAAYDNTITEFKQATVTRFLWSNPHALIDFDAKDAKGNPCTWWLKRRPLKPFD